MKVTGAGNSGGGRRGFDVIGKVVEVGLKHNDQNALKVEVMRGAMKGKTITMILDPEIAGKNENANKIGIKGLVASNKNVSGVGGVIHFQSADYLTEKDSDETIMQSRWAYMAGDSAEVAIHPASLLVLPSDSDGHNIRTLWPDKGAVVRDGKVAEKAMEVAKANPDERQVYVAGMTANNQLDVRIISMMKNDNGEYVTRNDTEMAEIIATRLEGLDVSGPVAVIPGSNSNLSKQAGMRMVNNKAERVDLIVGFSNRDILLSNGTWLNDISGETGTFTNRVEHATVRAAGVVPSGNRTAAELELSDENKFKRVLGHIEGYADPAAQASDDAATSTSDAPMDADDPFADVPEAEETAAGPR